MNQIPVSRRAFLAATAATGFVALTGCGSGDTFRADPGAGEETLHRLAYRLSARGKRASRAAKSHAANKLFATSAAADANRAHPGDKSTIVTIDISPETWELYFGDGDLMVDLRRTRSVDRISGKLRAEPLPIAAFAAEDGRIIGPLTGDHVARALQDKWGIATAAGLPINGAWITLPAITALGRYTAELDLPLRRPQSFLIEVLPDDLTIAALALKEEIESASIKVPTKVGENGKIFGSVTTLLLSEAMKSLGLDVASTNLSILDDPIKEIGTYRATYTVRVGIVARFSFEVVEE